MLWSSRRKKAEGRGARARVLLIAGLTLALGGSAGAYLLANARCFALSGPVHCRAETREPLVALTFDDGPTESGVAAVLPVLERYGAQATFFVTGREAEERPELTAQLLAAGHELGNHSYSHQRMVLRPAAFYDREIAATEAVLRAAGSDSGLFRPPYGKKLIGLPQAVGRHGLRLVMWDVEDPRTDDPQAFAQAVVASARPGSIILIHAMYPANETARAALPQTLAGLQARGFRVVGAGALLDSAEDLGAARRLATGRPPRDIPDRRTSATFRQNLEKRPSDA